MVKLTKDEMLQQISDMTVLDLSELVSAIEKKFNVSATPPQMAVMPTQVEEETVKEEQQTEFEVYLQSFGAKKILVIKEVRAKTGLGLKESKALVDASPGSLVDGLSKMDADAFAQKLKAVGATVEVK